MNRTAATFFYRTERIYRHDIVLHIARLTDSPSNGKQRNLSIRLLPDLVNDAALSQTAKALVDDALTASAFVKSWRNIALAHTDHDYAVKKPTARQIEDSSRAKFRAAIGSIGEVMRSLCRHYCDSDIAFEPGFDGAAEELIARLTELP